MSNQSSLALTAYVLSFITKSTGTKVIGLIGEQLFWRYIISERRTQYFDVECTREFLGVFFYVWSQCWFVQEVLVLCRIFYISFSPSKVGAADRGLFLLAQIRDCLWSMTPRRKGVNFEPSPVS